MVHSRSSLRMSLNLFVVVILLAPCLPLGGAFTVDDIEGLSSLEIIFNEEGHSLHGISIPRPFHLMSASMEVSGRSRLAGGNLFPSNVSVDIGDDQLIEWAFDGQGYGPLVGDKVQSIGKTDSGIAAVVELVEDKGRAEQPGVIHPPVSKEGFVLFHPLMVALESVGDGPGRTGILSSLVSRWRHFLAQVHKRREIRSGEGNMGHGNAPKLLGRGPDQAGAELLGLDPGVCRVEPAQDKESRRQYDFFDSSHPFPIWERFKNIPEISPYLLTQE